MVDRVVPMIHVPDVGATVEWYKMIGFTVICTHEHEDDGELDWAALTYGSSEVMFNAGGMPSTFNRREIDLYIFTDNVDDLYLRLKDRVEVQQPPEDAVYGNREFIIRDNNGFWVTFGQILQP
jgi:uncharacterized glyoxalase superfamily protein PhnB